MKAPALVPAAFLARYDAMDRALVAAGFPSTSPWWRAAIERFVTILGSRLDDNRRRSLLRRWVLRCGRRSGKSTTLSRLLVCWALWGAWLVPPGDTPVIAIVSVDRSEAAARLKTVSDILTALGVPFEQRAEDIALIERRVVFKVFTCAISSVGFTAIAIFGDEVALWSNRETGQNPASRVVPQLAPTLATQPFGFMILSSAAWTKDDYHAQLFDEGDTQFQIVSAATTWEANPTLTEQDTHALEPSHADWLRAYGNVPSDAITENFFAQGVELSIDKDPPRPIDPTRHYTIAIDPKFAATTRDRFGVAVISSVTTGKDPNTGERTGRLTIVHQAYAWAADRSPLGMAKRLQDDVLRPHRHDGKVYTDQFEGFSFQELCKQIDIRLEIIPWTGGDAEDSKFQRFRAVRMAMFEGAFRVPNEPDLLRELRSVRRVLTPAGNERIEVPRTSAGHGDRVSAIVLGASIALASKPRFPTSAWTYQDYCDEQIKYNDMCRRSGGRGGHPIFNPNMAGWMWSWSQLQGLIKRGEWKDSAPSRYGYTQF
jgi:hypothetical protein